MNFWFLSSCLSKTVRVAERGANATYVIIVPHECHIAIRNAADILKSYVNSLTGVKIDIESDDKYEVCPEKCVLIGETKFTSEYLDDLTKMKENLGDSGFHIEICDEVVIVFGNRRGCNYGIMELLEKYWGVYRLGRSRTVIPTLEYIDFSFDVDEQIPYTEFRQIYWDANGVSDIRFYELSNYWDGLPEKYVDAQKWIGFRPTHTFEQLINPWEEYDNPPEYFSLINGKRVQNSQLCISNPDVHDIVLEKVSKVVEECTVTDDIRLI